MISTFEQAQEYLYSFISDIPNPFVGGRGLERITAFLQLIGNPQDQLKVVHVAGTSGKGSTAFYISTLLRGSGFKVGLHVSPHLADIRERFQINNSFLTHNKFIKYLNMLTPAVSQMEKTEVGKPSYFELLVSLSFFIFHNERVDYAVMETGLGGQYDATNAVNRQDKTAVITPVGFDHMSVLGNNIEDIARHKAKIIRGNNLAVAHWNSKPVRDVIETQSRYENATLVYVRKHEAYSEPKITREGVRFDFHHKNVKLKEITLATRAMYQAENASVALTVLTELGLRDKFNIREDRIRELLGTCKFPGRMEELEMDGTRLILDGAHNPQKMEAFIASLTKAYPKHSFHFLIAFKKSKDYSTMLELITPYAKSITFTKFILDNQDMHHKSEPPEMLLAYLTRTGYAAGCAVENPFEAFDGLRKNTDKKDIIVVTGSLYLLSCLYAHIHEITDR